MTKDFNPDHNRAKDEMLERARSVGGEELVEQIKIAKDLEGDFFEAIGAAYQKFMAACEAAKLPEALACSSACNAFSNAYAVGVALLGAACPDAESGELLASALRSFVQNLDRKMDEVKATSSGVEEMITNAAKKFGESND